MTHTESGLEPIIPERVEDDDTVRSAAVGRTGGGQAGKPRTVQRGMRYAATVTDYRNRGRLVATLCEVDRRLAHAKK